MVGGCSGVGASTVARDGAHATGSTAIPPTSSATTAPVETAVPASASVAACPSPSHRRVSALLEADPSCFGSSDVTVIGWEDAAPLSESGPPGIQPQWLWLVSGSALWDRPRGGLTDLECSEDK